MANIARAEVGGAGCQINSLPNQLEVLRGFSGRLAKHGAVAFEFANRLDGAPPTNIGAAKQTEPLPAPSSQIEQLAQLVTECHDWLTSIEQDMQRIGVRLGLG